MELATIVKSVLLLMVPILFEGMVAMVTSEGERVLVPPIANCVTGLEVIKSSAEDLVVILVGKVESLLESVDRNIFKVLDSTFIAVVGSKEKSTSVGSIESTVPTTPSPFSVL